MAAFFDAGFGLGLGTTDVSTRGQALVAEHPQGFDLGTLAGTFAVLQHLDIAWTRHAALVRCFFFFHFGAPQHQQLADVLDRCGVQFASQDLEHGFACGAVIRKNANLDQPVGVQGGIDFLFDVGSKAVASYHYDGVKVVGFGAVIFALGGCQLNLRHTAIIGVMKTPSKGKKVNKAWLHDHINDPYVKLAHREGYRARAAYKLKEIDEALNLIKPGHLMVDLGSVPGAWSQYARRRMSPQGAAVGDLNGTIIALDMLAMEPIEGVHFIQGDFRETEVLDKLTQVLASRQADLVVSDMAPNLSGIASADAARVEHLIELAIEFAQNHMKPQGSLVVKAFHGGTYDSVLKRMKAAFEVVKLFKPKASRGRSSEIFLVGIHLKADAPKSL